MFVVCMETTSCQRVFGVLSHHRLTFGLSCAPTQRHRNLHLLRRLRHHLRRRLSRPRRRRRRHLLRLHRRPLACHLQKRMSPQRPPASPTTTSRVKKVKRRLWSRKACFLAAQPAVQPFSWLHSSTPAGATLERAKSPPNSCVSRQLSQRRRNSSSSRRRCTVHFSLNHWPHLGWSGAPQTAKLKK
jgi:hypothetical protein